MCIFHQNERLHNVHLLLLLLIHVYMCFRLPKWVEAEGGGGEGEEMSVTCKSV